MRLYATIRKLYGASFKESLHDKRRAERGTVPEARKMPGQKEGKEIFQL